GARGMGFLLDAVDDLHEDGEIDITRISQRARSVSAEKHPRLGKLFLQLVYQAFLGLGESGRGRRKARRHHHGAKKRAKLPKGRSHGISFRATWTGMHWFAEVASATTFPSASSKGAP